MDKPENDNRYQLDADHEKNTDEEDEYTRDLERVEHAWFPLQKSMREKSYGAAMNHARELAFSLEVLMGYK